MKAGLRWLSTICREIVIDRSNECVINREILLVVYSLLLHPQAEVEATKGTVEILMESDPAERIIHPILLDINQIQIQSVSISQIDDDLPVNVRFSQLVKNDGRLLELDLVMTDLKFSETVKLSVVIKFVSQITKTLNGIYKVDYKDDLGEKAE